MVGIFGMFGLPGEVELLLVAALGLGCLGVVGAILSVVYFTNRQQGKNLIQCPDCKRGISPSALSCPNCGRPNESVKGK